MRDNWKKTVNTNLSLKSYIQLFVFYLCVINIPDTYHNKP